MLLPRVAIVRLACLCLTVSAIASVQAFSTFSIDSGSRLGPLFHRLDVRGRRSSSRLVSTPRYAPVLAPFTKSICMVNHNNEQSRQSVSEAHLRYLLSRRKVLFSAASIGAAGFLLPSESRSALPTSSAPVDTSSSLIGDYNKAPGKLVVFPDNLVEKSPSDQYSYRALTLPNGLRVLLASDPKADTAAAALDVHVGHYSDPDDIPGLAHFNEHMLFLGNKKFPEEGQLESFLSAHGGSSNAYTSSEDTCYFFTVNKDSLLPALERFSQFFVSPLFTASATSRELNAIESEHSKNLQSDSWRLNQVFKLRGNPSHPFAKFGTGNRATLKDGPEAAGVDLRARLLDFYSTYYSANQMTLAICGREDLDTLQRYATSLFADVPNRDAPPPEAAWAGRVAPFDVPAAAAVAYEVVPVDDVREMSLQWVVPYRDAEDRRRRRLAKPEYVVAGVLGYEGPGSLLSYLKERGWVSSLTAAIFEEQSDFQIFGIAVSLTPEGLPQRDAVGQAVFSYLRTIREEGLPDYLVDEAVRLSDLFWTYRERQGPGSLVNAAAASMQEFPDPRRYLSGPGRVERAAVDRGLIDALLAALRPEAALVTATAREFAARAAQRERWYGTAYAAAPARAAAWAAAGRVAALRIPPPNPFIPADGALAIRYPPTEDLSVPAGPPDLIRDDDRWQVFYKGDRRYGQPKAVAYFQLALAEGVFGAGTTPRTSALAKLYRLSLQDALNEYAYPAAAAGLQYALDFTARGAALQFSGLSARLGDFAAAVTRGVAGHAPADAARFERHRDVVSRELRAFDSAQPYQHAAFYAKLYQDLPSYEPREVDAELAKLTLADLREWAAGLWARSAGRALVQGNLRPDEARAIVASVEEAFAFAPLPAAERAEPRHVVLPAAAAGLGSLLRRADPGGPGNPNSAVLVQYQSGPEDRSLRRQMAMEVLGAAIEQPFYAELRTRQQLGYIVFAGVRELEPGGARALNLVVQSSVADPPDLAARALAFAEGFAGALAALPDAQFRAYVDALVQRRREGDKTLAAEAGRHWGEIASGRRAFDRAAREAEALAGLTKADVLAAYRDVVLPGGAGRRVFTAEVYADRAAARPDAPPPAGAAPVPPPREFIAANALFPPVGAGPAVEVAAAPGAR